MITIGRFSTLEVTCFGGSTCFCGFGAVPKVLTGSFETLDGASNETLLAGPGDRISIPGATLHAARCPTPATYVVGFESEEAMKQFGPEPAATLDS